MVKPIMVEVKQSASHIKAEDVVEEYENDGVEISTFFTISSPHRGVKSQSGRHFKR